MTQTNGISQAAPGEAPGRQGDEAQQLKEEIERTREQLGETVGELVIWRRGKR